MDSTPSPLAEQLSAILFALYQGFCSELVPVVCIALFLLEIAYFHHKCGSLKVPFLPSPKPIAGIQTNVKKQAIAVANAPKAAITELETCTATSTRM